MTVSLAMEIKVSGQDNASKMFAGIAGNASKATASIEGTIKGMDAAKFSVVALNQALDLLKKAYDSVSIVVKQTVGAYMEAEGALMKLSNAMKMTNSYSEKGLQEFVDLASELQQVSKFGDDTTKSLMALGKSAGYSNETVKSMTIAAANLATITGMEIEPAFEALMMTFTGNTRAIARYIPEVKNLTDAQASAGKVIDLVNEKFKDAARNERGLTNAWKKIQNSIGELEEEIGKGVVTLLDLDTAFGDIRGTIDRLTVAISRINFVQLRQGLREAAIAFGVATTAVVGFVTVLTTLRAIVAAGGLIKSIQALGLALKSAFLANPVVLVVAAIAALAVAIDLVYKNLTKFGDAWTAIWEFIKAGFESAMAFIYRSIASLMDSIGLPSKEWKTRADEMSINADRAFQKFKLAKDKVMTGWDWGFVQKIINSFSSMGTATETTAKKTSLIAEKVKEVSKVASEEVKAITDELKNLGKETENVTKLNERWGKTAIQKIRMDLDDKLNEIKELQKRAAAQGIDSDERTMGSVRANKLRAYQQIQDEIKKGQDEAAKILQNIDELVNKYNLENTATPINQIMRDAEDKIKLIQESFKKYKAIMVEIEVTPTFDEKDMQKKIDEVKTIAAKATKDLSIKFRIEEATALVSAMRSGSQATISYISNLKIIADKWGAIGQLIGGIIDFFNRPPDQFRQGIKELLDGIIKQLIPNLLRNIPVFVEMVLSYGVTSLVNLVFRDAIKLIPTFIFSVIKAVGDGMGAILMQAVATTLRYAAFGMVKTIWKAVKDSFKAVFFGEKSPSDTEETTRKVTTVTTRYKRVSDTAAGSEEFKVREYIASETAATTWETKVKTVTGEQEESLENNISTLWKLFVRDIFDVIRKLTNVIMDILGGMVKVIIMGLGAGILIILQGLAYAIGALIVGPVMALISLIRGKGFGESISEIDKSGERFSKALGKARPKYTAWVQERATATAESVNQGIDWGEEKVGGGFGLTGSETTQSTNPMNENPQGMFGDNLGQELFGTMNEGTGGKSMLYNLGKDIVQGFIDSAVDMTVWAYDLGKKVVDGIIEYATPITDWCASLGKKIWDSFSDSVSGGIEIVKKVFSDLGGAIFSGFTTAKDVLWDILKGDFGAAGKAIFAGFWNTLVESWASIKEWFGIIGKTIFSGFWSKIVEWWADLTGWFTKIGNKIWSGFWDTVVEVWDTVVEKFTDIGLKIWNGFWDKIADVWDSIVELFGKIGSAIYVGFWNKIVAVWKDLLTSFKDMGITIYQGLQSGLTKAMEVGGLFYRAGKAIVTGLIDAIKAVWEFFSDIGKKIWSGVAPSAGGGAWTATRTTTAILTGGLSELFHNGGPVEPLRFADGGSVPGFGFMDSVPALLTPGEHVLTQSQAARMREGTLGGTSITINIAPNADVSESAIRRHLVPAVLDAIDRNSQVGRRFVNARGVYG